MNDAQLLIVDDEQAILHMLTTILKKEEFKHIDTASTAEEALALCQMKRYNLIFLDVMLPGRSGFEICPLIRETTAATIFFLTARSTDLDKIFRLCIGCRRLYYKTFQST